MFSQNLGIPIVTEINMYLMFPINIRSSKNMSFNSILDKIKKKLNMWKANSLSYVGRVFLIKSMIHVIPTYVMSSFLLLKVLYRKIESLTTNFWWGENKIHLIRWNKLCKSKQQGGLGSITQGKVEIEIES